MARTKISEFSSTPANNTDIDSINIAEGCAPSNINDAIRELMAQLKDFQIGSQGDSFNGPIGTTTAAAGAFTTLSASSTLSVTGAGSIQGLTVGRGAGAVATNTAVGAGVLGANTTGSENTALGSAALTGNTTGTVNTAIGNETLYTATTATQNVAVGHRVGYAITSGGYNSGLGALALRFNTTGQYNTALGNSALFSNTTASNNTAVGYQSLYSNLTGDNNVGIGWKALYANTTGLSNSAVGLNALLSNTTGGSNVAMGQQALQANTTASNNTAVGYQAGYSNTTAGVNVYVGYQAGYTNSLSQNNVFIGNTAGYTHNVAALANGFNTAVGAAAGYSLTTGTLNTFIGAGPSGFGSGYYVTTGAKNTILGGYNGNQGGLDIRTASNYIVLSDGDGNPRARWDNNGRPFFPDLGGDAGTNAVRFNTGTGRLSYDTSSAIYKNNIRDSVYGLSHVMQMRSTQFEYKSSGRSDVGLIAEEVDLIIPELVGKNTENQPDSVSYDRMVSVLIKAIQELKAEFDAYKASHP